jgi:hypothetical protein
MLRRSVWPFVGVVLTAACAGVDRVVPEYSDIYTPNEVSYASTGRDFATEVHGNPFRGDQVAFNKAITDALQRYYVGPPTTFTTTPDATALSPSRVVFWFNPAAPVPNQALCLQTELPSQPPSGDIVVAGRLLPRRRHGEFGHRLARRRDIDDRPWLRPAHGRHDL